MEVVKRGLTGRRVCGSIEIAVGILMVIGALNNPTIESILFAAYVLVTGILGTASKNKCVIIIYLVTGIILAVLLFISIVFGLIAILDGGYQSDETVRGILIAAVVIIALLLLVTVLGAYYACLPLCGTTQEQGASQYHHNTSTTVVTPPTYDCGNLAYPHTKQQVV